MSWRLQLWDEGYTACIRVSHSLFQFFQVPRLEGVAIVDCPVVGAGLRIFFERKVEGAAVVKVEMEVADFEIAHRLDGISEAHEGHSLPSDVQHVARVIGVGPVFYLHFGDRDGIAFELECLEESRGSFAARAVVPTFDHGHFAYLDGVSVIADFFDVATLDGEDIGVGAEEGVDFEDDVAWLGDGGGGGEF